MPWKVDKEKCSGCGLCVDTAPDVFKMDDDEEFAECIDAAVPKDDDAAVEAAESCPEESIAFED